MNYSLTKKKAKELVEAKLSHFMGVTPEEATNEQYYKAIALILREMMSEGRAEFNKLAQKEGKPVSAQAVGQALGHNPLLLVIPCHRVVGADGSLTGYAGGLERKKQLLALEQGK